LTPDFPETRNRKQTLPKTNLKINKNKLKNEINYESNKIVENKN
jgi:hypothetical protein